MSAPPYDSNASLTSSSNGGGSDNNNGGDATGSSRSTHESSSTSNITMETDLAEELNKLSIQDREKIMSDIHAIETQHSMNQELQQLSSQQREEVLYDIHGVSGSLEETEELITQSLTLLKEHLSNRSNEVYRLALQHRNADYIQSREFLLMFLRADDFDTSKAADRLLQFLQQKLDLFGLDKLCQRISLQDLNEDDTQVLMRGYTQLLPHRDRAGRAVIVHMPAFKKFRGHENQLRYQFYLIMSTMEDIDTQRKGLVFVVYRFGPPRPNLVPELSMKQTKMVSCLPFRIRGWHFCSANKLYNVFYSSVASTLEQSNRVRARHHAEGTHAECLYSLMTFGINVEDFPVADDLTLKLEMHWKWISQRRKLEALRASSPNPNQTYVVMPTHLDVLFGRGKPIQEHPGNLRLCLLVEGMSQSHSQASKMHKTQMTRDIVKDIQSLGGRFLKQEEEIWVQVPDTTARSKVSHMFRNIKPARTGQTFSNTNTTTKHQKDDEDTLRPGEELSMSKRSKS